MGQMNDLKELYEAYLKDSKFDNLRRPSINFVPGSGPLNPTLMLVGEAPGRMENAKRIPFVGQAGINLTNLLEDVGIDQYKDVFQTNVVKYWPPQRIVSGTTVYTPTEEDIETSSEYLQKEIEIVNPVFVGMCGRSAIKALFPDLQDVFHSHGKLLEGKYVPLYHPAVLCYNPQKKTLVREGYTKLKAYIDSRNAA